MSTSSGREFARSFFRRRHALSQLLEPVQHHLRLFGRSLAFLQHEELPAVGRNVVHAVGQAGSVMLALKQQLWLSWLKRRSGLDGNRHQLPCVAIEQLAAAVRPHRLAAAVGRDLPPSAGGIRRGPNVDFKGAGRPGPPAGSKMLTRDPLRISSRHNPCSCPRVSRARRIMQ